MSLLSDFPTQELQFTIHENLMRRLKVDMRQSGGFCIQHGRPHPRPLDTFVAWIYETPCSKDSLRLTMGQTQQRWLGLQTSSWFTEQGTRQTQVTTDGPNAWVCLSCTAELRCPNACRWDKTNATPHTPLSLDESEKSTRNSAPDTAPRD